MIKIIKGNLIVLALQGEYDYIIHGCNCYNIMGAGIAALIADTFPEVVVADTRTQIANNKKLGDYTLAKVVRPNPLGRDDISFFVVNAYTQFNPGPDFRLYALEMFLWRFKEDQEFLNHDGYRTRIGVPWIGCGIGGGKQTEVKKVLTKFAATTPIVNLTIVEYKP